MNIHSIFLKFFSTRTTGPISTKLDVKQPGWKRFLFVQIKDHSCLRREISILFLFKPKSWYYNSFAWAWCFTRSLAIWHMSLLFFVSLWCLMRFLHIKLSGHFKNFNRKVYEKSKILNYRKILECCLESRVRVIATWTKHQYCVIQIPSDAQSYLNLD